MTTEATESKAKTYPIRAVDRVCDILDALANAPTGVALSDLAAVVDLPKSSVFRYLAALEARRYVERDETEGLYRLGIAFRPQHTDAMERLTAISRPALENLRDQLGETTNLGILDGTYVVHAVVAESPHMMRLAARVGERGYIHCTALGKAIAATLPEDRVRSILTAVGMPPFTDTTITDPAGYLAELKRTTAQGYGLDEAENQAAGRCVAVAIAGLPFPAGVSVSAPVDRFPEDDVPDVVAHLQKLAASISRKLQA